MKATELIGKKAIRTTSTVSGDGSYTDTPVFIIHATDTHIVYESLETLSYFLGTRKPSIMRYTFCDNNWIDYAGLAPYMEPESEVEPEDDENEKEGQTCELCEHERVASNMPPCDMCKHSHFEHFKPKKEEGNT